MDAAAAEEFVRRIATAVRGADLYSPHHPLVQRGIDNLAGAAQQALHTAPSVIVGFIDDEIVVDGQRLPRGTAALVGFARDLRDREIDKLTFTGGVTRDEIRHFIGVLGDRTSKIPLTDQLTAQGVRHITLGKVAVSDDPDDQAGSPPHSASMPRRSRPPSRCGKRPRPANSRIRGRRGRSSTAWHGSSPRTAPR